MVRCSGFCIHGDRMGDGWDSKFEALAAVAFAGLGALLATNVLTLDDINLRGGTLVTFIWLRRFLCIERRG